MDEKDKKYNIGSEPAYSGSGCADTKSVMRCYVGTKIIRAIPMTNIEFDLEKSLVEEAKVILTAYERGQDLLRGRLNRASTNMSPREDLAGYKVLYPDGYVAWSPRAAFEHAYRLVSVEEAKLI